MKTCQLNLSFNEACFSCYYSNLFACQSHGSLACLLANTTVICDQTRPLWGLHINYSCFFCHSSSDSSLFVGLQQFSTSPSVCFIESYSSPLVATQLGFHTLRFHLHINALEAEYSWTANGKRDWHRPSDSTICFKMFPLGSGCSPLRPVTKIPHTPVTTTS